MELRFSNTEVRASGNVISGYASVFYDGTSNTEYEYIQGVYERIDRKAMERAIAKKPDVRALFNHDANYLLGRASNHTLKLSVDERGLKYEIQFDPNDPDHQKVQAKILRGDLTGSSFAFYSDKRSGSRYSTENGRDIRTIVDLDIFDVGPVVFPAYTGSSTSFRSADKSDDGIESYKLWKESQKRFERVAQIETEKRMQIVKNITI